MNQWIFQSDSAFTFQGDSHTEKPHCVITHKFDTENKLAFCILHSVMDINYYIPTVDGTYFNDLTDIICYPTSHH